MLENKSIDIVRKSQEDTLSVEHNTIVFENDEIQIIRKHNWMPPIKSDVYVPEEEGRLPEEIRQRYSFVNGFSEGYSVVGKEEDGKLDHLIVDLAGNESYFTSADGSERKEYAEYGYCFDGMFGVSNLYNPRLAYWHDCESLAGICGFVNTAGREIIAPQYIFAYHFKNGRALVCKGKWTKDKKWDNQYVTGGYWSEEMLWGMIDKTGKEVIPCIYEELEWLQDPVTGEGLETYYKVCVKVGDELKWGVIDHDGNWAVEPKFAELVYDLTSDGLFAFYTAPYDTAPDRVPMGIYSMREQRIILEPDPSYIYINFLKNGHLSVESRDENDRMYDKVIDLKGKPIIDNPDYRVIIELEDLYYCIQWDTDKRGVLDKNGNIVLPVMYSDIELHGEYLFAFLDGEEEVYQVIRK